MGGAHAETILTEEKEKVERGARSQKLSCCDHRHETKHLHEPVENYKRVVPGLHANGGLKQDGAILD